MAAARHDVNGDEDTVAVAGNHVVTAWAGIVLMSFWKMGGRHKGGHDEFSYSLMSNRRALYIAA